MRATIILVALLGCASTPVPADRMAQSQASLRAAEEVGAKNVPPAALHLQLAQEQMEQGKQLIKNGDNERARFVLLRAEADAELAVALAREQSMRDAAQKAVAQVHEVEEMR